MFSDLRAQSLPTLRRHNGRVSAAMAASLLCAPLLLAAKPVQAQQAGYGQTLGTTPMERQLYDGGTGRPNSGSILDSTNPIDLMNKLRRGTAMDEATPPSSAIDQALQQLEAQSAPAASAATSAPAAAGSQAAAAGVNGATVRPASTSPAAVPPSQSGSTPLRPAL